MELIFDKTQYSDYKHYCLGCLFYNGIEGTVEKNMKMAYEQFSLEKDHNLSNYNLGCMFYNGNGVEKNIDQAYGQFCKDCSNFPPSSFGAGLCLLDMSYRDGHNDDEEESEYFFKKCLEHNYNINQSNYYLGLVCYSKSIMFEAKEFFEKVLNSKDNFLTESIIEDIKTKLVDMEKIEEEEEDEEKEEKEEKEEEEGEDFVEVNISSSPPPSPLFTHKLISDGLTHFFKNKNMKPYYYEDVVKIMEDIDASEDIINEWCIEGARLKNSYCLKKLGKKWLSENVDEE